MPTPDPRRWRALAVLALAQFMVVLDVTIVNVALPDIQADLGFSAASLQWVINAYVLLFGGFLLLGGRAADLLGRRRMFLTGLTLFTGASLAGGFASSEGVLIGARAVQGLGAALLSPAALGLVTSIFPAGRERNSALGVWGALAGLGGTVGVVAGGVLVDALGWQWVLWVNVPVGLLVAPAALRVVAESRADNGRGVDVAGALSATGAVLALVYGVIRTNEDGWGSPVVLGLFAAAVALAVLFVRIERRVAAPLVPLRLFASRGLSAGSTAQLLAGASFISMFFLTALYLQDVMGASALRAGLEFVPMGVAAIAAAVTAPALVQRVGTRRVMVAGASISLVGLLLLSRADAGSTYLADVLPGLVVFGIGLPLVGVSTSITAVSEVRHADTGVASGIINAGNQIGGALGLAVVTTLANSRAADAIAGGAGQVAALSDGFQRGMLIAALFAGANLVIGLASMPAVRPTADDLALAAAA